MVKRGIQEWQESSQHWRLKHGAHKPLLIDNAHVLAACMKYDAFRSMAYIAYMAQPNTRLRSGLHIQIDNEKQTSVTSDVLVGLPGESSRLLQSCAPCLTQAYYPPTLYIHINKKICMQWNVFCHKQGWRRVTCRVFLGQRLNPQLQVLAKAAGKRLSMEKIQGQGHG